MSFSISVNGDTRLFQKFGKITNNLENFQKPLKESGDLIVKEVDKQFDSQGSRLTGKWKALKAASLRQKMRAGYGGGILVRSGALKGSFGSEMGAKQVRVSSKGVSYYKYHQLGMSPQPKREMLALNERLKQDVVGVFTKHLKTLINE